MSAGQPWTDKIDGRVVGYWTSIKQRLEFVVNKEVEELFWAAITGSTPIEPYNIPEGVKINVKANCELLDRFLYPRLENRPLLLRKSLIFQHDNAPAHKAKYTTSLLTTHSPLCLTLVQYPTTRPSIWSTQWRSALISEDDIGEILFVITFCPFHFPNLMFFSKKWAFDFFFALPMDWRTLQRVVLHTIGADAASKTGWMTEWGFFTISFFEVRKSLR